MIISFQPTYGQQSTKAILPTLCLLLLTTCQPLHAATPRSFSGGTMLAADRADLSLDTGLWRGEFLKAQDEQAAPGQGTSDNENHQSLQALRNNDVRGISKLVNLEGAAEEYFEDGEVLPVQTTGDDIVVTGEIHENLSDWEQAICNVSDGKALAAGQKGPSMITAIVAVVGVIVVIGAYMKK